MFRFHYTKDVVFLGKYDGSTFEGSDKLSMAIMRDLPMYKRWSNNADVITIAEGDRFMNNKYIDEMNPIIIRILGDGEEGRIKRGSNQTERHLKAISTRINNIVKDRQVVSIESSQECVKFINKQIDERRKLQKVTR